MTARFVTTSIVTKRAGIAALFVTLVTKRAVVTKRATTNVRCAAVEERPEAKEVQLSQPSSTSLLIISSGLRVPAPPPSS